MFIDSRRALLSDDAGAAAGRTRHDERRVRPARAAARELERARKPRSIRRRRRSTADTSASSSKLRFRSPDRPSDHGRVERRDRIRVGRHQLVPDEAASGVSHMCWSRRPFCHSPGNSPRFETGHRARHAVGGRIHPTRAESRLHAAVALLITRFGSRITTWHSGTAGQRRDITAASRRFPWQYQGAIHEMR